MSTLAKTYSLSLGVPFCKPEILEQFFPLETPLDKVILIHAGGGARNERNEPLFSSKIYDHYEEVIRILFPILNPLGYKFYQIGAANESPLGATTNLCGATSMRQTAYLLRRCALFIGNDSMNAHMAGALDTPSIILYGPTDIKNHGPEWFNKDKTILLESHRFGAEKPSYSAHESAKTINAIPPEKIINGALKLLGLPQIDYKSYLFGAIYRNQIIEIVPDNILRPDFFPEMPINLRLDFLDNPDGLEANLKQRKTGIFANKPFDIELVKSLRHNLAFCRIEITEDITPEFAKKIIRLGAPYAFFTKEKDERKLKELRYQYYDIAMIDSAKYTTIDDFWTLSERYTNSKLDRSSNLANLSYRSNKYIVSAKGIFLSKAAWKANKPIPSLVKNVQSLSEVMDDPEFWHELQNHYIFEQK